MRKFRDGEEREPHLRSIVWFETGSNPVVQHLKSTPKVRYEDDRRWQLELKELQQPPKKDRSRIIVPAKAPSS